MATRKHKPVTPSERGLVTIRYDELTRTRPLKSLTVRLKSSSGRNSQGRITVRHRGGGVKRLYRIVDFKQDRYNMPAEVKTLEYDPYRTAFIARIRFSDGVERYMLAPHDLHVGDRVVTSENAELKVGNRLKLKNIPVGYQVYSVETSPSKGGQLARSAGSFVEILANAEGYTDIKLSSGEVRKVPWEGYASIGHVSNPEHNLRVYGKAGRRRWLGRRPVVRGSVMNPVDHPYGGGEGKTQRGTRKPKTIWGKITGGRKTRKKKKWSNSFIVKRRK